MTNFTNIPIPLLKVNNDIVVEVNKSFIKLTNFLEYEILGLFFNEVLSLLKIDYSDNQENYYLFTKKLEPIEIKIIKYLNCDNEIIYYFVEENQSKLEEKLPYASVVVQNNIAGTAIFTGGNRLLKANKKYFEFINIPYNLREKYLGKNIFKLLNNKNTILENVFNKVINTKSQYVLNEFEWVCNDGIIKYYTISVAPLTIGSSQYIVTHVHDITERVILKKRYEEKNKELEAIIESMSDAVIVIHENSDNIMLNNVARQIFCNPKDKKEFLETLNNNIYFDSNDNIINYNSVIINSVFKGNCIKNMRITSPMTGGSTSASVSASPILDKYGNVEKIIISIRDITVQVKKDKLIKEQKEKLEGIINNISDEIAIIDKYGDYVLLNKASKENPLTRGKLLKNIKEFEGNYFDMDGNYIDFEHNPTMRVLNGERFKNERMLIKDENNEFIYEVSGIPINSGKMNSDAGLVVFHNITDKIKYEENKILQTHYELLNQIIENADIALTRLSYPDLKIIDMNNKAFLLTKKANPYLDSLKSLKEKELFSIETANEFFKEYINGPLQNVFITVHNFKIDGEEKYYKQIVQPIFGLNNNILEVVIIGIDITELVKEKKELENSLRLQDELFVNVSHELKTPLNIIYSAIQLIEIYINMESLKNSDKIVKSMNSIKHNCYRLTKLINNILDASKIESGRYGLNLCKENIVDVVENIVQSVTDFVKSKELSIIFDTDLDEKYIMCDVEKIERVILNLLSNAIKFTNSGGEIFVSVMNKGDNVEITVKDNGIGIDNSNFVNIFSRFNQVDKSLSRNAEGSGIGLSLTKSIVELMGGTIRVISKLGEGSEFIIDLPCTLDSSNEEKVVYRQRNMDMINIEFSDIYDKGWSY